MLIGRCVQFLSVYFRMDWKTKKIEEDNLEIMTIMMNKRLVSIYKKESTKNNIVRRRLNEDIKIF